MWDVRTHKMLHAYTTVRPADGLDISGRGMLAVGQGSHVQVWKDALSQKQNSPYMVSLPSSSRSTFYNDEHSHVAVRMPSNPS